MSAPSQESPPPEQSQEYPGRTSEIDPRPRDEMRDYEGPGLLAGKRALITGGDSGIGRAVAVAFAKEGVPCSLTILDLRRLGAAWNEPPHPLPTSHHRRVSASLR